MHPQNKDFADVSVVIIGAGISGMCTAIDLIKRNKCRKFVILEKSSGVGGTWHDNCYPGSCCDVWSALYSYSFEQNSEWTREYPGQEEILTYLIQTAQKYGLYKHIRFNSTVQEARWDDRESKWKVKVGVSGDKDSQYYTGYVVSADFLVSAVGQLNMPREPNIPGLRDFEGKMMHSARWDWTYDWKNKRVAVIGNGATAAQIVPEVVKEVSLVTVYQRTPNWVIPRQDAPVSPFSRALLTLVPPVRWRKRALMMDYRESFHSAVTDNDSLFAQQIRDWCTDMMRAQIPNKQNLWPKLTPKYAPGCKRVIISDDWFPALARDNVTLETHPIERVTATGIELANGESQEFDLIVLATGFKTVQFIYPIQIYGSKGKSLSDIWKEGARAYYGVTVDGMPNFGMCYGPNTNLGHNSIILMIEAQSRYINALAGEVLEARRQGRSLALEPKPEVVAAYNQKIQDVLQKSSFADPECNSWYKQDDGKITNNWPGTVVDYQVDMSQVNWDDYLASGTAKEMMHEKKRTNVGRVREESLLSNSSLIFGAVSFLAVVGGYFMGGPKLLRVH